MLVMLLLCPLLIHFIQFLRSLEDLIVRMKAALMLKTFSISGKMSLWSVLARQPHLS